MENLATTKPLTHAELDTLQTFLDHAQYHMAYTWTSRVAVFDTCRDMWHVYFDLRNQYRASTYKIAINSVYGKGKLQ